MNSTSPESSRLPGAFWSVVFAAALIGGLAAVLYAGIHKLTHHRPLGAATLAVLVMATFLGLFAVSWRLGIGRKLALATLAASTVGLAIAAMVS